MSVLKCFVLMKDCAVVHGAWWAADAPTEADAGIAFDNAVEVERPADPRAETWSPEDGFALSADADTCFERDIDLIAEESLVPRAAIAVVHQHQAAEARRWDAAAPPADPAADCPHLHAQAVAFGGPLEGDALLAAIDARATAILGGVEQAARGARAAQINARRLKAKADLRAATSVADKTAVVVAFRTALAAIPPAA